MEKKERIAILTCIAVIISSFLTSFMPREFVFYYSENWLKALLMLLLPDAQPASWLTAAAGGFRWVGPFFGIWGAFGLYMYFSNERRNVTMLQFMLGFLSVKLIFTLFFFLLVVLYNVIFANGFWDMLSLEPEGNQAALVSTIRFRVLLLFFFWILGCTLWAALYIYSFKVLGAKKELRTDTWEERGVKTVSFVPTEKAERFFHVLLDSIIMIWFIFTLIPGFIPFVFGERSEESYQQLISSSGIAVFLLLLLLLYYPLTEGLFRRSLTKTLTNSVVANDDGSRVGLGRILIRTLCRLIPFNPFSFFGESGWHDRFSKTYVLKEHIPEPGEDLLNFQFTEEAEKK